MAVTSHVYTMLTKSLGDKLLDLDTDAFKVMLLSAYTPNQNTHQFLADVLAAGTQASGTGYTATGQALASVTLTRLGNVYKWTATDPSWDASGGSLAAAYAVFYCSTPGSDATRPVVAYWDFGGTETATNGLFTLDVDAAGIATFTAA